MNEFIADFGAMNASSGENTAANSGSEDSLKAPSDSVGERAESPELDIQSQTQEKDSQNWADFTSLKVEDNAE
jgi:hypothetical protein